jgi:hypothetical protein
MKKLIDPTDAMKKLLIKSGSLNRSESLAHTHQLAVAFELPLRKAIFAGDIVSDVFVQTTLEPGASPIYPTDLIIPGAEGGFTAYAIPAHGAIPERTAEGDYITIPTYEIGNSIDWTLKMAREARWDIIGRYMEIYKAGYTKKLNDDGWHVILAAAVGRNILVYDSAASAGQFTKRLVSLMKTNMRRNGGGNSSSVNRRTLTDLYISPEGVEDIRDWGVDQVDETTRREIYVAADGSINRIFSVNLHDIDELGVGMEYQNFFTSDLSGSLQGSDVELVIGLDLTRGTFVMPVRQPLQTFEDDTMHRQRRAGVYGWTEVGFGSLDGRDVLAGSF